MALLIQQAPGARSGKTAPVVCRASGMRFKPIPTHDPDVSPPPPYDYSDDDDCVRQFQKSMATFTLQQQEEEDGPEVQCGLGTWRPAWLQRFANHRVYAASFIIVGIVQGMIYSYFNGVITTVEKAFGIPSRTLGIVLSGNDISQILCGLLVTYLGGKGSRPLWLAFGMLMTAASCFMYASAQLFWDDGDAIRRLSSKAALSVNPHYVMCGDLDPATTAASVLGGSSGDSLADPCAEYPSNVAALVVFFVGQFISGVGSTALFSLGFSYMDDNVKKSVSPLYMTLTTALRSFGPTLGYTLASFCLNTYIDPGKKPEYSPKDPRWLGAWWLGFLVVGVLQVIITFPIALFPKKLKSPSTQRPPDSEVVAKESDLELSGIKPATALKEFFAALLRIVSNPVMAFSLIGTGPLLLGVIGYSTFLPKYLEAQFAVTAAQATLLTGVSGMAMMMTGSLIGGLVTYKCKPRASYVALYGVCVDLLFVVGILINMNYKCDSLQISGASMIDGILQVNSTCSRDCDCPDQFNPVCVGTQNFLSPCLAGCTAYTTSNQIKTFYNCTCADPFLMEQVMSTSNYSMLTAKSGYCPGSRETCKYLWPYIIILGVVKLLASSTRVGGILIFVRSVDKRDKALSMALMGVVTSILGFIPSPILYGAVVDSTCLLWEILPCGRKGNCWLYNIDDFRYYFHAITMVCFLFAVVFDLLIAIYARQMNLYGDDPPGRVLSFREGIRCVQREKKTYDENEAPITKK